MKVLYRSIGKFLVAKWTNVCKNRMNIIIRVCLRVLLTNWMYRIFQSFFELYKRVGENLFVRIVFRRTFLVWDCYSEAVQVV